ncbi:MAG: aminopeptidase, partial [Elusimicrobia bacterium]|nr:aminopeptidase [Elusimicrobiota bacterium]
MAGVLLGKEPRYAPNRPFDTLHVKLDLNVDMRRRTVSGTCTTSVRAIAERVTELSFDAVDLKISRVRFQGRPAKFTYDGKKLVVKTPHALESFEEGDVEV